MHTSLNNILGLKRAHFRLPFPLAFLSAPTAFSVVPSNFYSSSPSNSTPIPNQVQPNPPLTESGDLDPIMPEDVHGIPVHPVAPRLQNGHKKPHVGPNIHAYKAAHAETLGHESDHWWSKVSTFSSSLAADPPFRHFCLTALIIQSIILSYHINPHYIDSRVRSNRIYPDGKGNPSLGSPVQNGPQR